MDGLGTVMPLWFDSYKQMTSLKGCFDAYVRIMWGCVDGHVWKIVWGVVTLGREIGGGNPHGELCGRANLSWF